MNFGFLTIALALISSTDAYRSRTARRKARCNLPIWAVQSMSNDELARYQAFFRRFCAGNQ